MKLTPEQTEALPFPIGCPVWYNFPEKSSSKTEEPPPLLKEGVVESVSLSFNYGAKDLIYEVVYRDGEKGTVVDEISEQKLAYAANCPVTIDSGGEGSTEGTVLLCEQSPADPSKFVYTVMIDMEGPRARYEDGIEAARVKYRSLKKKSAIPDDAQEEQATAKISGEEEGIVPSSIACVSVAKISGSKDGGSNKRSEADFTSPLTATPKKKTRVVAAALPDNDSYYTADSRPINSRGPNHATKIDLRMPLWLQKDRQSQKNLFFHLIGSKREKRRGLSDIGPETNSHVKVVNFNPDSHIDQPPMIVTVDAFSSIDAPRDHRMAREKITDLLLVYMDIHRDGSKGRLVYEIAAGCPGPHRPNNSSSRAVNVKNPFDQGRSSFISIVELPFELYHGRREFHASYLLDYRLREHIQKNTGCSIRVCGDDFDVPTRYCDPYVLVFGRSFKDVDQAVYIVKDDIRKHIRKCVCDFK